MVVVAAVVFISLGDLADALVITVEAEPVIGAIESREVLAVNRVLRLRALALLRAVLL